MLIEAKSLYIILIRNDEFNQLIEEITFNIHLGYHKLWVIHILIHTHTLSILAHGVEYMLDHIINETLSFAEQSNVGWLVMHRSMPLN